MLVAVLTVLKYHVIDGRRCEVKKALTKSEMHSMGSVTGANSAGTVAGLNQDYGAGGNMPYGMPPSNMGGWQQGAWNMDENAAAAAAATAAAAAAAAGNYGYPGAPCNHNPNTPCGHFCGMNFGNVAGMLGSMLASMGAQGMNMAGAGPAGGAGPGGYPGQNAVNMPGQSCFVIFTLFADCSE